VCIEAKGNQYGSFSIGVACHVLNFKLVYVSGDGVSLVSARDKKGYWGSTYYNNKDIHLHITDTSNERISPPANFPLYNRWGMMAYQLPGVTNMDPKLTFPELSPPLAVTAGQQFRIWFGEDLTDQHEDDNSGVTCADVWIKKF
jgi:hypothetical protein